jgi:hypothetical protein
MRVSAKERCAISETGTGFAGAKLSEILPAARVARFVRMTNWFHTSSAGVTPAPSDKKSQNVEDAISLSGSFLGSFQ